MLTVQKKALVFVLSCSFFMATTGFCQSLGDLFTGELFTKAFVSKFRKNLPVEFELSYLLWDCSDGHTQFEKDVWELVKPYRTQNAGLVFKPLSFTYICRYPKTQFPKNADIGLFDSGHEVSDFWIFTWDLHGNSTGNPDRLKVSHSASWFRLRDSLLKHPVCDLVLMYQLEGIGTTTVVKKTTHFGVLRYEYRNGHWSRTHLKSLW